MRVLHGARRRGRARRLRDPGGPGGRTSGHDRRGPRFRGARGAHGRLRRSRRISVWFLHPRDRRARRSVASEASWLAGRPRSGARRPPLPLHRLGDRLRGHRRRDSAGPARCAGTAPRNAPSSKGEYRSGWEPRSRSARAASPTTERHETRSWQCRCRQVPVRHRQEPPAWSGLLPSPCTRRGRSPRRCRGVGPPPSSRGRWSSRHFPRAACGSSPGGSSPPTSSPTRRGASRGERLRHRSRTAARSGVRRARWSRVSHVSSPTAPDARCAWCSRGRTSCGSDRNVRRSRPTAVFDDRRVMIDGVVAGPTERYTAPIEWPYRIDESGTWTQERVPGPPTASHLRGGRVRRTSRLAGGRAHRGGCRPRRARA